MRYAVLSIQTSYCAMEIHFNISQFIKVVRQTSDHFQDGAQQFKDSASRSLSEASTQFQNTSGQFFHNCATLTNAAIETAQDIVNLNKIRIRTCSNKLIELSQSTLPRPENDFQKFQSVRSSQKRRITNELKYILSAKNEYEKESSSDLPESESFIQNCCSKLKIEEKVKLCTVLQIVLSEDGKKLDKDIKEFIAKLHADLLHQANSMSANEPITYELLQCNVEKEVEYARKSMAMTFKQYQKENDYSASESAADIIVNFLYHYKSFPQYAFDYFLDDSLKSIEKYAFSLNEVLNKIHNGNHSKAQTLYIERTQILCTYINNLLELRKLEKFTEENLNQFKEKCNQKKSNILKEDVKNFIKILEKFFEKSNEIHSLSYSFGSTPPIIEIPDNMQEDFVKKVMTRRDARRIYGRLHTFLNHLDFNKANNEKNATGKAKSKFLKNEIAYFLTSLSSNNKEAIIELLPQEYQDAAIKPLPKEYQDILKNTLPKQNVFSKITQAIRYIGLTLYNISVGAFIKIWKQYIMPTNPKTINIPLEVRNKKSQ